MPTLTPVDHDPFPNLVPVDHDPFADNPLAQYNTVARAIGREVVRPAVETYEHAANLVQGRGDYGMELANGLIAAAGLAAPPGARSEEIAEQAAVKGIEAWHGSPAEFTRFSDEFIGTGEGGQSFGRGHYVAENKEVASSYRKEGHLYNVRVNADPKHFLDYDKPLNEQDPKIQEAFKAAIDELAKDPWYPPAKRETIYNPSKPAGQIIDAMGMEARARGKSTILEDTLKSRGVPGIKYLDQGSRGVVGAGASEAVRLRASIENQEAYIESTQSLVNQSPSAEQRARFQAKIDEARTNIADMERQIPEAEKAAAGGTRNFVVFNPDTIEILKKYGIAGLISAGVAHQTMTPVDHDPFKDGS